MEKREVTNYDDEIDLFELFEKLYQQKWFIIGITSVITVLTAIISIIMPKVYKASVYFEFSNLPNSATNLILIDKIVTISSSPLISVYQIKEMLDKSNRFKFRIDIKDIRNSITKLIETEGKSPEDAENNLLEVINYINMVKFQQIKEDLINRLNFINSVLLELNTKNNILYDPLKKIEVLEQKQKIEKWLQKPELIIQSSEIIVTSKPVRPKPLLYTMIGFVTGLFLAIFIALIRDFIINRKKIKFLADF